ncbi:MAG TPA: LysE family transporter [Burkholderiaceae bacterium]|jgi:threonine/homoserine/homoserine lactone efflux protein|nr:LysE family transporter [Burkholderiaceae bacterium]
MALNLLLKGLVIGVSIAAPVGPIGLLCVRRSLEQGVVAGLATGLGAATADAAYGCVAGFGLTAISGFLVAHATWLRLGGGATLCWLGARMILARPAQREARARSGGVLPAYFSTLLLTLANPMTILSLVAVFAGFGLVVSTTYAGAATLVAGVFVGSGLWWLFLSTAAARMRHRVSDSWMRAINRLSGGTIVLFGLYALSTLLPR